MPNTGLGNFFKQDGVDRQDAIENLVEEATSRAEQVKEEFNLGAEFTPGLIKLSFYDFLILCGRCPHLRLLHISLGWTDTDLFI
jgi:hypothetical protein